MKSIERDGSLSIIIYNILCLFIFLEGYVVQLQFWRVREVKVQSGWEFVQDYFKAGFFSSYYRFCCFIGVGVVYKRVQRIGVV